MAVTSPTYPRLLLLISPAEYVLWYAPDLCNGGGELKRLLSRFKTCKTHKTLEKIDVVTGSVDTTAAMESVIRTRRDIEKMQGDRKHTNIMEKQGVTMQNTMERQ